MGSLSSDSLSQSFPSRPTAQQGADRDDFRRQRAVAEASRSHAVLSTVEFIWCGIRCERKRQLLRRGTSCSARPLVPSDPEIWSLRPVVCTWVLLQLLLRLQKLQCTLSATPANTSCANSCAHVVCPSSSWKRTAPHRRRQQAARLIGGSSATHRLQLAERPDWCRSRSSDEEACPECHNGKTGRRAVGQHEAPANSPEQGVSDPRATQLLQRRLL